MSWNPKSHKPKKQIDRSEPIPSGTYVLGATWLERRREWNFVKLRLSVLAGPMKGRTVFTIIPTNVEKAGTANVIYHFLRSMNRLDMSIDFDNQQSMKAAFLNAAFKAKVTKKTTRKGDRVFVNHDLSIFLGRNECSREEIEVMKAWEVARASVVAQDAPENFRDDRSEPAYDDDGFPTDDFGDDEIPF